MTCVCVQVAGRECITTHLSTPAHSRLSGPHCATPPACIPRLVHQRKRLCFLRITSSFLPAWFCLPAIGHVMPCLVLHCRLKSRYTTSLRPFKLVASWFICCVQQSLAPGWLRHKVCKLVLAANQPHCLFKQGCFVFQASLVPRPKQQPSQSARSRHANASWTRQALPLQ